MPPPEPHLPPCGALPSTDSMTMPIPVQPWRPVGRGLGWGLSRGTGPSSGFQTAGLIRAIGIGLPLMLLGVVMPSEARESGPAAAPTTKPTPSSATPAPAPTPGVVLRRQTVEALPGGLDRLPVLNDNNPELISTPGILLSSFAGKGRGVPSAHLDRPLQEIGRAHV